ncbi:ankyrin repeat-containing domain protein [Aspergillus keveii]|uniref:Ankyrin repeat-containing domain protein n=1 Tax=Aspergillus keveii TaxID=714993 RepID=A0ABR4FH70_9EURO
MELMLTLGINMNRADLYAEGQFYGPALHETAREGYKDLVRLLLDNKANVNHHGGEHGSALQAAAYRGWTDIVQLLLDNGANVGAPGDYNSALVLAAIVGNEDIVRVLLTNGVDINAQDETYGTALRQPHVKGKARLCRTYWIRMRILTRVVAIMAQIYRTACAEGHKYIAKILLEKGANVFLEGEEHGTVLAAAINSRNEEIVHLVRGHMS